MPNSWLVPSSSLAAWVLLKAVVARYEQSQRRVEQQRQMVQLAQRLETLHHRHRGLSNLPVELMSEIFCFATIPSWPYDWDDTVPPSSRHSGRGTQPFNLLRVCRRWRQIALTTPELWATFNPRFPRHHPMVEILRISEEWLLRARNYPLSVNMEGFGRELLRCDPIIDLLHRHAPRVRSLKYWDLDSDDFEALNWHGNMDLARLEQLELGGDYYTGPLKVFGNAPRLREVLIQVNDEISLDQVNLPWAQIVDFTLHGATGQDTLTTLAMAAAVTRCNLRPTIHDPERDEIIAPLTHHSIQHLTLLEASWELENLEYDEDPNDFVWPTHLLDFLTMPALQTLEIIGHGVPSAGILWDFFERSQAPLRKLILRHEEAKCIDLTSMEPFVLLNELAELEISWPSRSFLELFSQMFASSAKILPRLQTIVVDCARPCEWPSRRSPWMTKDVVGEFSVILLKRCIVLGSADTLPLRSLRITTSEDLDTISDELPGLALVIFLELKEKGMRVHIGTDSKERSIV
uniref:F-box domain-containing protein n=1 Tax=Mycena chlorophos TaxID=658473 RepID=A0ABQ0LPV8_MYCCL|nr:predicted protein [Mycena chlorophos]